MSPPISSTVRPIVLGESSTATRTAATSSRVTCPRGTLAPSLTRPVPASLVSRPGARRSRRARSPHRVVCAALRAQVHAEGVIAPGVGIRPHAADYDVAADSGLLRCRNQLRRPAIVHRLLARGPTPGPGARGENDSVGAGDGLRDIVLASVFEVDHGGSAPACLTSSDWSGFRIRPTASSPRSDKTLARRMAIWPWPPAMATRMASSLRMLRRQGAPGRLLVRSVLLAPAGPRQMRATAWYEPQRAAPEGCPHDHEGTDHAESQSPCSTMITDVSDFLPSLDVPVRLDDVPKRIAAVDDWSEQSGLQQVLEVVHHRLVVTREGEQN